MEAEVDEVVGPKGKHNPDRTAKRHGHEHGSMTLGGRRVEVGRPRIRTADDERELPVQTYEYFADRDPLTVVVMNRMLAGVSTRRYAARASRSARRSSGIALDVARARCRSCSSSGPAPRCRELMSRRLDDVRLAVMMLDGIEIADRTHVVALGITTEGVKIPLGLWEGLDRERHPRARAARRPGRPGPGSRAGDPVRDRRLESALNAVANFEFERVIDRVRGPRRRNRS